MTARYLLEHVDVNFWYIFRTYLRILTCPLGTYLSTLTCSLGTEYSLEYVDMSALRGDVQCRVAAPIQTHYPLRSVQLLQTLQIVVDDDGEEKQTLLVDVKTHVDQTVDARVVVQRVAKTFLFIVNINVVHSATR